MLPTEGKPVASAHWHNQDEAFANVVTGLRQVIEELALKQTESSDGVKGSPSSRPIGTIAFPRNPYFTGREDLLTRLHNTLTTGSKAALTQPQAISGLGGIGKTQTAIEYAYRYRDEYQMLLWARAETREDLVAEVVAIAELLNLPEKSAHEQQITTNAVKQWLETHSGWLLILDNADHLTIVRDFLPTGNRGHILLTTRAQVMGGIARQVQIETMLPEERPLFLL